MSRLSLLRPSRGAAVTAVLVTAGVLSVGIVSTAGKSPNPRLSDNIQSGGALASVERFTHRKLGEAKTSYLTMGRNRAFYAVDAPELTAVVDAFDGQVVSVVFATSGTAKPVSFDPTAVSARVLKDYGLSMPGATPVVTTADHGAVKYVDVTWQKMKGKVKLPATLVVELDAATGKLVRLGNDVLPYADPPYLAVTQAQAEQAAKAASGLANPTVESAEALVTFDATGAQQLVWRLGVFDASAPASAQVEVDGVTGEAVVVGRG